MKIIFASVALLFCVSCEQSHNDNAVIESDTQAPSLEKSETEQMVEELASIAKQRSDPRQNPYLNSSRADAFGQMMAQTTDPQQRIILALKTTQELLQSGRTKEAIQLCEPIVVQMEAGNFEMPPKTKAGLYRLLGVCYMRLGEQVNCQLAHTAESCIWPIKDGGVHKDRTGSEQAIELYERALSQFPADMNMRWLLNIAYQTLGQHPTSVPAKWLLPVPSKTTTSVSSFVDIAMGTGLDVNGLSGGVIMEDLNGDDLLDIMVSSWSIHDQIELLINNGDGTFKNRTHESGLVGLTGGLNLIHADIDNDGDQDVLVLRGAWLSQGQPNSLLLNDGNGNFTDVSKSSGIYSINSTQAADWIDFDQDGDVDLFIANESKSQNSPCELFVNDGKGSFTQQAETHGLAAIGYFKGCAWGDVNNDGFQDLYLSDLKGPNKLFINQGPEGAFKFIDQAEQAGVTKPQSSFPTWFWDVNNDGALDLFVASFPLETYGHFSADVAAHIANPEQVKGEFGKLYINNGRGSFQDATGDYGLAQPLQTMGSNFGDINNDGLLDMYLGTGEPDMQSIIPNRLLLGSENGNAFNDITSSSGTGHLQKGHGVAFGDIDNDGDQDIYITLGGAYEGDVFNNALFLNPGNENHWIKLILEGSRSDRNAIGARVHVSYHDNAKHKHLYRTVGTGGSFGSQPYRLEIGLGAYEGNVEVEVTWPSTNEKEKFGSLGKDDCYILKEGSGSAEKRVFKKLELQKGHLNHEHHH